MQNPSQFNATTIQPFARVKYLLFPKRYKCEIFTSPNRGELAMDASGDLRREDPVPSLPATLLGRLQSMGEVQEFKAGDVLLREGETSSQLYVLLSGKLKIFASQGMRREVVYNTLHPGEYFGELAFDGGPRSASVQALQASRCLVVSADALSELVRSEPEFAVLLITKLMRLLRRSTQQLKRLALDDVRSRVLSLIEEEAVSETGIRHLPKSFTQRDIAHRVGATREMVNHVLGDLVRDGFLAKDQRLGLLVLKGREGDAG